MPAPATNEQVLEAAAQLGTNRVRFPAPRDETTSYTITASSTIDFESTWVTWTADVTTSNTSEVWISWTNDSTDATTTSGTGIYISADFNELERATIYSDWSREAHTAKLTRSRLEQTRKQRPIKEKAAALLQSILTEEQWSDWRRHSSVRVNGSDGGLYEIGCGWAGMLYRLDPETKEPLQKLCCHPSSRYPTEDRVATLVLALQTEEQKVVAMANTHHFANHEKERVKLRRAHRAA